MRTSIWLVRHGQTVANQQRRYQSWSDSPLTEYGQRQISALTRRLSRLPFDVALISPTQRTRLTAAALLADRPDIQRVESSAWTEASHGHWEGLTYYEVLAQFPDEARQRFADTPHGKPSGGESLAEVAARVQAGQEDLLRSYSGQRVLIITHATPIQLMLCALLGLPPSDHWHWRVDLGSISCLDVYATGSIVRMVNEVPRFR